MTADVLKITLAIRGRIGDKIIQRVAKGKGNILTKGRYDLQIRSEPPRRDARSPLQLRGRARMKAATTAYQALSSEERRSWRLRASRSTRTGYNLFIAEFCATHPLTEF